jgi:phosphoenolpyruvate synthase/pyruvate phosphate dikinase
MDIEFAVKGKKIFILQARPITALKCHSQYQI